MSVVLANCMLTATVHARPSGRDSHGYPVIDPDEPAQRTIGPFPGAVSEPDGEDADGVPWSLRADPRCGNLERGDLLSDGTRRWVVRSAKLVQIPGYSAIDFVRVVADLDPPRVL